MNQDLETWKQNGWLRPHEASPQEIADLWDIVERDLEDARSNVSMDWKLGIAYNAVLKLCTILLYASGYKPERNLAHYRTLIALPKILKQYSSDDADFLDACRKRRNTVEYDYAGASSQTEVDELLAFAEKLKKDVFAWLKENKNSP